MMMVHEFSDRAAARRRFNQNERGILRSVAGKFFVFDSVEDARGHPTTDTFKLGRLTPPLA